MEKESKENSIHSSNENSGLSHRLHPSLRRNSDTDPYAYGFTSPKSPTPDNSLSSFVPKTLSSYSPQLLADYSTPQPVLNGGVVHGTTALPLDKVDEQMEDFYVDLTSNTAALLW